jgi:hypothetical protein
MSALLEAFNMERLMLLEYWVLGLVAKNSFDLLIFVFADRMFE